MKKKLRIWCWISVKWWTGGTSNHKVFTQVHRTLPTKLCEISLLNASSRLSTKACQITIQIGQIVSSLQQSGDCPFPSIDQNHLLRHLFPNMNRFFNKIQKFRLSPANSMDFGLLELIQQLFVSRHWRLSLEKVPCGEVKEVLLPPLTLL